MFKELINNVSNKITDKVNTIKEEKNYYKELLVSYTKYKYGNTYTQSNNYHHRVS